MLSSHIEEATAEEGRGLSVFGGDIRRGGGVHVRVAVERRGRSTAADEEAVGVEGGADDVDRRPMGQAAGWHHQHPVTHPVRADVHSRVHGGHAGIERPEQIDIDPNDLIDEARKGGRLGARARASGRRFGVRDRHVCHHHHYHMRRRREPAQRGECHGERAPILHEAGGVVWEGGVEVSRIGEREHGQLLPSVQVNQRVRLHEARERCLCRQVEIGHHRLWQARVELARQLDVSGEARSTRPGAAVALGATRDKVAVRQPVRLGKGARKELGCVGQLACWRV